MVGIWISAPHFTGAVYPGRAAAPIVKYMQGWPLSMIVDYCQKRKWHWEYVRDTRDVS